jgi:hypothetical protein
MRFVSAAQNDRRDKDNMHSFQHSHVMLLGADDIERELLELYDLCPNAAARFRQRSGSKLEYRAG